MYYVSFPQGWKLQDVQAALNVTIAFLCAGGIFVLVRYCWQLAARRVAARKDVPAYTLLSLNTIGEAIDIIWLLRKDLFATRYHGLLIQCLFVVLLTCATLSSGFIARWCTRYGNIAVEQTVNGSLAVRSTGSLLYAEIDTNATLFALQRAQFPADQLLEYLPEQSKNWNYVASEWNSSWSMDCTYTPLTEVPNVRATGNCTNSMWTEVPQLNQLWTQMPSFDRNWSYAYDRSGWRNNLTAYRDILVFMHGIRNGNWDDNLNTTTDAQVRSIAVHLEGAPWNTNVTGSCTFSTGPITRMTYTDCFCKLTRKTGGFKTASDAYYGAYPDAYSTTSIAEAYSGHWANNFRKESARGVDTTVITGQQMAQFYQAYLITKDTSVAPFTLRTLNIEIQVAQINLAALVCCCIIAVLVLLGLSNYLIFVWRNWHRLDKTPQSKLDWMLQTIRHENVEAQVSSGNDHGMTLREKLRHSKAFGGEKSEVAPLTGIPLSTVPSNNVDRKSVASTIHPSPELDYGFDQQSMHSDVSGFQNRHSYPYQTQGPISPPTSWMPFQPQNSYAPVGQGQTQPSPYSILGHGQDPYNTAYDPGRR